MEYLFDDLKGLLIGAKKECNKRLKSLEDMVNNIVSWDYTETSTIEKIFDEFIELHGDRQFKDDKAIVCGLARIGNQNFTIIAEQKGRTTKENIERKWYVIDAEGKNLGRVATKAAHILRGKHKVTYTPYVDCGDYVIIVNASKVNLTGNKLTDKKYYNHSGYPGGLRERTAKVMIENYPEEMMERAVKGMLPHNRLGRKMGKKLFVYADADHKHSAQKPIEMEI